MRSNSFNEMLAHILSFQIYFYKGCKHAIKLKFYENLKLLNKLMFLTSYVPAYILHDKQQRFLYFIIL